MYLPTILPSLSMLGVAADLRLCVASDVGQHIALVTCSPEQPGNQTDLFFGCGYSLYKILLEMWTLLGLLVLFIDAHGQQAC